MGKGDKKSRKGKRWRHSYGLSRKRKKSGKGALVKKAAPKAAGEKPATKKAAPKKKAAKKTEE